MNKYELAVVVNAKLEDEERAATLEKVKDLVTRFGGTITDVDDWGKKKLAYEIQKMTEGYYYFIHFEADGTCPGEIETRIRIMEGVITVDEISSLELTLAEGTVFTGQIVSDGETDVVIEEGASWILTGDSYVDSLEVSGNLDLNGYSLYVDGELYEG